MKAGEKRDIAQEKAQKEAYHRWKHGSHILHAGLNLMLESAIHFIKMNVYSMKPLPGG